MKVTVIGGGNIGTLLAAELSKKGFDTYIYSSKTNWADEIEVFDHENNFLFKSEKVIVTDDIKLAVKDAEFVFVTYPPALFEKLAHELDANLNEGTYLGIIPGSGGAEFAFKNLINQGIILFGFQRVHSIARLKEYGRSVYMLGRKDAIHISVFRNINQELIKKFLEELLEMPCHILNHYLNITLNPSNQILHTARLYSLFKNYEFGDDYPENILFYETWDNDSSDMLIKCDEELQLLCNAMPMNLENVKSLKDHYESFTVPAMTEKISNIPAFKGLTSPMIQNEEGNWVPDFSSRYFSSDYSYGLKIIIDMAELYGIDAKNLKLVWSWFLNLTKPQYYFELEKYGLNTKELLENYY